MTLKELEEFCNGLGFDGKISQCCGIENALYCDLRSDYDVLTVIMHCQVMSMFSKNTNKENKK